ncbi:MULTISPECIES: A24 family peptidase [unclassified Staphylococcus]|uniref:prepilin peptidase n=1 Tax=Staphylococcus sp. HMSC072B07 TaxID=1739533 RepID=UPI0015D6684E
MLESFLYQLCFVKTLNFSYMKQRSKCETCHHDLKWYDLVPIISFVILKGRCRYCRHKLSKLHVIGELCALLPIGLLVFNVIYPSSALFLALYLFLLVAALYDMHTHTIPVHFDLIFIIVVIALAPKVFITQIGIVILLHILFILAPHAIGYGDILIFTLLSLVFPYLFFLMIFCMTFIIGGLFMIMFRLFTKRRILEVPLIPFIFISFLTISIFYPNLLFILHFY